VGLPAQVVDGKVFAVRGSIRFEGTVTPAGEFTTPHLPPGSYKLTFAFRYPTNGSVPTPESNDAGETDVVVEWAGRP
jgi:hypothetical protein